MSKELAYQKMAITSNRLSCGYCDESVLLEDCIENEEKLTGHYSYRLTLTHKKCGQVIGGADV